MITFAILILIVAKALPGLNTHISSIHVTRITSIVLLFAGTLSLNTLNLESIGSGIGIYSGFFQVTTISQLIEIFLFMIGGGILVAWPQIKHSLPFPNSTCSYATHSDPAQVTAYSYSTHSKARGAHTTTTIDKLTPAYLKQGEGLAEEPKVYVSSLATQTQPLASQGGYSYGPSYLLGGSYNSEG
jgi:hypothetical protein